MEASGDPKAVLKDISKFDKSGLEHVVPEEKIVLPSAEEIKQEKSEKALLDEIEKGTQLKHTCTVEKNPLPTKQEIQHEKTEKQLLEEITHHPKLRRASTLEKNPLPTPEVIAQEKKEKQLLDEIEHHPKLKPAQTMEKNPLPTQEGVLASTQTDTVNECQRESSREQSSGEPELDVTQIYVAYSQNGDRRSTEYAVMVEAYQFTPNAQEVPQMLLLMDSFNSPVIKQGFDELFCLLLSRAGT
ncbi:hypothetical protein CLF_102101 [Clonorchis sinensis]|uniref:WH2 domain-containing protein n=1 Tax=Clonorchis sinensis TaxID=79923 RepID=G7Y7A7_CLOSI|nr:hypothetical protein CLF_102101 [Clonorchis sinensis]